MTESLLAKFEETLNIKSFVLLKISTFLDNELQGVCSANGVFQSIDLTKASTHDATFFLFF